MEDHWSNSQDKLIISAEEGLNESATRRNVKQDKTIYCSERLLQIVKLILYLQLICFVAWGGYTFWQAYNRSENVRFYIVNSNSNSSHKDESLKVLNESSSLPLNNVEETLETITTTDIPMERDISSNQIVSTDDQGDHVTTTETFDSGLNEDDIFIKKEIVTDPFESISTYRPTTDSSELRTDYENKVEDAGSSSEIIENKDKENSVEQAVFDWDIPFLSTIHRETELPIDDSSKETGNSETSGISKELFKEDEDRNEGSDYIYDEYDSFSKEIKSVSKLIRDMMRDVSDNNRSFHGFGDSLASIETSSMDETSNEDSIDPNVDASDIFGIRKQASSEAPAFISEDDSEEKTKLSLFHDRLIEKEEEEDEEKEKEKEEKEEEEEEDEGEEEEKEDPYDYLEGNHGHGYFDLETLSFVKGVDSEKSDTSKVEDDATSDLKSESWERPGFHPFCNLHSRMQDSSIETSKTEEESTERNISTDTSRDDTSTDTALSNEKFDKILKTLSLWGLSDRDYVEDSLSSSIENPGTEEEIQDGEGEKNGKYCFEVTESGFKIVKCFASSIELTNEDEDLNPFIEPSNSSFISFVDGPSKEDDDELAETRHFYTDLRDPTDDNPNESKSFDPNSFDDEFVDPNDFMIEEPTEELTDSTNSESETPDFPTEGWWTTEIPQDNFYQDTTDPISWWLDLYGYRQRGVFGDEMLERKRRGIAKIKYAGQNTFSEDEDSRGRKRRRRRIAVNDETLVRDWIQTVKTNMINERTREYSMAGLDEKLTRFYSDMDVISSHIDALHELYLRERKLEDDYVSKEFLNGSP